jgi:hypothetical protein
LDDDSDDDDDGGGGGIGMCVFTPTANRLVLGIVPVAILMDEVEHIPIVGNNVVRFVTSFLYLI